MTRYALAPETFKLVYGSYQQFHPTQIDEMPGTISLSTARGMNAAFQLLVCKDTAWALNVGKRPHLSQKGAIPTLRVAAPEGVSLHIEDMHICDDGYFRADALLNDEVTEQNAEYTRAIYCEVEVPADAPVGKKTVTLTLFESTMFEDEKKVGEVTAEIEIYPVTMHKPTENKFYLDLWQHLSNIARKHEVTLWSDEHFAAMKPLMARLADAGQKVITATLNKDPWNHQCYDGYESMILWTKHKDGSWSYDYKVFDRWVELMLSIGINKMINCYSMVPWNCELEYMDEAKGEMVTIKAEPGTAIFPVIWEPFLKDFKKHLEAKGWLAITNIAMDERSPEAMDAAVKVLEKCAPEMGFALADNHKSYKKYTMMRDVCVAMLQPADLSDIHARREQNYNTTFYVCCGPLYPNTFTSSEPYEAEMLGWYNLAHDYDGMLRWAYNSWPADPQVDSRYGNWMAGDTYLVYPYNRSSIRFERLIDGIETAEKVRALRRAGVDTSAVEAVLEKIRTQNASDPTLPWMDITVEARKALHEVSR